MGSLSVLGIPKGLGTRPKSVWTEEKCSVLESRPRNKLQQVGSNACRTSRLCRQFELPMTRCLLVGPHSAKLAATANFALNVVAGEWRGGLVEKFDCHQAARLCGSNTLMGPQASQYPTLAKGLTAAFRNHHRPLWAADSTGGYNRLTRYFSRCLVAWSFPWALV